MIVRAATIQRPLRRNALVLRVACPTEPCTLSASGGAPAHRVALRRTRTTIAAGSEATVQLALSRHARRILAAALRRHRSVRAAVTVTDAAGNVRAVTRAIMLRR